MMQLLLPPKTLVTCPSKGNGGSPCWEAICSEAGMWDGQGWAWAFVEGGVRAYLQVGAQLGAACCLGRLQQIRGVMASP
jgi:hypothetical protein